MPGARAGNRGDAGGSYGGIEGVRGMSDEPKVYEAGSRVSGMIGMV